MNHFVLILSTAIMASTLFSCQNAEKSKKEQKAPNILYIMSDDHGYQAVSAYDKSYINTPNIDRIANEGILFTNSFVTNSICGPSRAVMLTGKHSHLNGFKVNAGAFDGSQQTFPKLLQKAGYQTVALCCGAYPVRSMKAGDDDDQSFAPTAAGCCEKRNSRLSNLIVPSPPLQKSLLEESWIERF